MLPIIVIYYFAQYSYIACIMLLKPVLAMSLRSFRNKDNKCFLGRNVDNSWEPGKIPSCQLDFPGLISPRGVVPLAPSSGPMAQITTYLVQNSGCQFLTTSLLGFF